MRQNLALENEKKAFAEIQEQVSQAASEPETVPTTTGKETETESEPETGEPPGYEPPQFLEELLADYPDCIGYLDVEGTQIHYPIMQNEDNEYYLHHDMDGEESVSGCIYMDVNHDILETGLHVLYGHHMKNGSMFKDVVKYADPEYMETHSRITVLSAEQELRLRPVYCYAGKADGSYRQKIVSHEELVQFITEHTGLEIDTEELYVLLTCSYGSPDERTYLYCVPTEEE